MFNYDFSGWATKNDLRCSDGRTIKKDAFKDNDGQIVPLVWNHQHNESYNVLGHALLENRAEGVYAYCAFNDTESGKNAKELVKHGDVSALSIYANRLKQKAGDVLHGAIREVSLVLSGANPGAFIDSVMAHGEDSDEECAIIYTGEEINISHSDEDDSLEHNDDINVRKVFDTLNEEQKQVVYELVGFALENQNGGNEEMNIVHSDEETVGDVFETLTDKQKDVVYAIVGQALSEAGLVEEDEEVKHNAFENEEEFIMHNEEGLDVILKDGKRCGSLKDSFLQHADDYGIKDIDWLFPEYKNLNDGAPTFINNEPQEWVTKVMNGVHRSPFARVKSMFADIREDEARARGYIKGKYKKEEVFSLLKRTTDPQTVYKKQKLDREDIVDITDFDVVSWIKGEMRMKLDEELARAILVGDGRLASDDDHISEEHIRPIVSDADLFTIKKTVTPAADEKVAHAIIEAVIRSKAEYQGSGKPTLYTSEAILADLLLLEDEIGRRLYSTEADLCNTLRVSEIVTFPFMPEDTYGIIVNLADYNVGADKGGSVNMFDDFDIDYNQQKYLIETRCSGALVKPYSAIVLKKNI